MFEINSIERLWFIRFLNVLVICHRIISLFKLTLLTPSNVFYSFDIRPIKNTPRKNIFVFFFFFFWNRLVLRITKNDLMPHAQMIFDSLFRILTSEKSYENEYVMRTVMRLSSSLHDGVLPYLSQLMEKLVLILRRSSRVKFFFRFDRFAFSSFFFRIQINRILVIIFLKRSPF